LAKETPGVPERQSAPESPIKQIITFLGSMQLGIVLLLLLAVISVFATTQPMTLAIENVYKSWWFLGIMAFTALNLLLCTIDRVGPLTRQALHPSRVKTADEINRMQINAAIKLPGSDEAALAKAEKVFRSNGLQITVNKAETGTVVFGEKGKYGYFGSIVTHFSLILILLGAMYGGMTGFESSNGGAPGERFFVSEGNFDAVINDVSLAWPEGPKVRPKATADITVNYEGRQYRDTTSINEPMRFSGVTLYQSSYGWIPILEVRDTETGVVETLKPFYNSNTEGSYARYGGDNRAIFHDKEIYIEFPVFLVDFTMSQQGIPITATQHPSDPRIVYRASYFNGEFEPWDVLPMNESRVIETDNGDFEVTLTGYENFIILSIAKNLGRPYLFIGSVLMILGLYMSFFLFPRRFWAVYDDKKSMLLIGGRGYRNRLGVEQIMERIESEIQSREEE
jgi:cytochrome c biogenesis protein